MTIQFFTSSLCPRSRYTERILQQLLDDYPAITIERIEIIKNVRRCLRQKIFMTPTLYVSPKKRLSGLLLGKKQLEKFLQELCKT